MIRYLLVAVLLLTALKTNAQDFEDLYKRLNTFKTPQQFDEVDREIMAACNLILSRPLVRERFPHDYYYAAKSMNKWMNNTESYSILIFGRVIEASQGDAIMQNMFMAAMGKYLLEQRYLNNRHVHPVKQPDIAYRDLPEVKETLLEGARIFFTYLKYTADVKPNKELKKGIAALEDNTLETYMFAEKGTH